MNGEQELVASNETPAATSHAPDGGDFFLAIVERAARDPTVDIEKFERLMMMRERLEARNAKQAFDAAVSEAKGEIGPIFKDKAVDFTSQKGRTNYRYESFAAVSQAVDPVLKRHGLSYRHRSAQEGTRLSITCVLSHRNGHSEETTLSAVEDTSGNKNPVQAIGSAATYLQRYTLKLALGLSAADRDDDGQSSGNRGGLAEEKVRRLQDLIAETDTPLDVVLSAMGVPSIEAMSEAKFAEAEKRLLARKKLQTVGEAAP